MNLVKEETHLWVLSTEPEVGVLTIEGGVVAFVRTDGGDMGDILQQYDLLEELLGIEEGKHLSERLADMKDLTMFGGMDWMFRFKDAERLTFKFSGFKLNKDGGITMEWKWHWNGDRPTGTKSRGVLGLQI